MWKFVVLWVVISSELIPHNFISTQSDTTKSRTQALSEKEEMMTGMRSCIMDSYFPGSTGMAVPITSYHNMTSYP